MTERDEVILTNTGAPWMVLVKITTCILDGQRRLEITATEPVGESLTMCSVINQLLLGQCVTALFDGDGEAVDIVPGGFEPPSTASKTDGRSRNHGRCDLARLTEPPNRVLSSTTTLLKKGSLPPAVASNTASTARVCHVLNPMKAGALVSSHPV